MGTISSSFDSLKEAGHKFGPVKGGGWVWKVSFHQWYVTVRWGIEDLSRVTV
jgi:hypothetical protein